MKKLLLSPIALILSFGLFMLMGCGSTNYGKAFDEAEEILANLEKEGGNMSEVEMKEQLLSFFDVIQSAGSQMAEKRAKIGDSDEKLRVFKSSPEYLKMQEFNRRLVELRRNNPIIDELTNDPEVVYACIRAGF